jgi:hypothetical protein
VLIAPSERAVVDVHFGKPGPHILEHRTPKRGKHQSRASLGIVRNELFEAGR